MTVNWPGPPIIPPGRIAPNGRFNARPAGGNMLAEELHSTFDASVADNNYFASGGITRAGGRVVVPCTSAYEYFGTWPNISLVNSSMFVEIPVVPALGNGTTEVYFHFWFATGNRILFYKDGTSLNMYMQRNGVNSSTSTTYNATNHRWWKISNVGSNILFDTSPDGLTWTNQRTVATSLAPPDLTNFIVYFESGYYGTETSPGNAEFDNINSGPTQPFIVSDNVSASSIDVPSILAGDTNTLIDDFTTQDTSKWTNWSADTTISSGRLAINALATYPSILSSQLYNAAGSYFGAQLVQTPNLSNGSTQANLQVRTVDTASYDNLVELGWVNGVVKCAEIAAGVTDEQYPTYNATAHRHLRIRIEGTNIIHWEGSPDGLTWTDLRATKTSSLNFGGCRLSINAGNYNTAPTPGTALWDNVNLSSYTPLSPVSVSAGSVSYGVAVDSSIVEQQSTFLGLLDTFATNTGKTPSIVTFYRSWSTGDGFPTAACNALLVRGQTPHIVWEPWDYTGTATQPAYQLADIIAGTYDSYITSWAQGAAAWVNPIQIRLMHEMNGNWYPWAEAVNGNSSGQYVTAWQRIHGIFQAQGATNVQWAWCPYVTGTTALSGLYPGDSYVDLVGLDGYNWGSGTEGPWTTFRDLFSSAITSVQAITSKPLWIFETAAPELTSSQTGNGKAEWITSAFAEVAGRSEIKGFVWFDYNKERDWRIISSTAAKNAFAAGIADARFNSAVTVTQISVSDSDTVASTDTPSVDAGSTPISVSDSDTVAVSDTVAIDAAIPVADTDTAAATETIAISSDVSVADSDTAASTDVPTIAGQIPVADSSSVSSSDLIAAGVAISVADSGTPASADALAIAAQIAQADSGTAAGSEALAVVASLNIADSGTASGVEAISVSVPISVSDSGTLGSSDALAITALLSIADSSTVAGSETPQESVQLSVTDSDTASASETVAAGVAIAATDAGTPVAAEAIALSAAIPIASAQTLLASETLAFLVLLSVADAGQLTATENAATSAAITQTDSGTLSSSDALLIGISNLLADTASLTAAESLVISASTTIADTQTLGAADLPSIHADVARSDSGTIAGAETTQASPSVFATDSGTLSSAEQLTISVALPVGSVNPVAGPETLNIFVTLSLTDADSITSLDLASIIDAASTFGRVALITWVSPLDWLTIVETDHATNVSSFETMTMVGDEE